VASLFSFVYDFTLSARLEYQFVTNRLLSNFISKKAIKTPFPGNLAKNETTVDQEIESTARFLDQLAVDSTSLETVVSSLARLPGKGVLMAFLLIKLDSSDGVLQVLFSNVYTWRLIL